MARFDGYDKGIAVPEISMLTGLDAVSFNENDFLLTAAFEQMLNRC
jgi:hypothetical protein